MSGGGERLEHHCMYCYTKSNSSGCSGHRSAGSAFGSSLPALICSGVLEGPPFLTYNGRACARLCAYYVGLVLGL